MERVLAGALLASTVPVSAADEAQLSVPADAPLTLQMAAREAVKWHPVITQAVGVLAARREEIGVARAGYLPQVTAGVGSGYDSRVSSGWRPRPQVGASQMLFDFGKVGGAVDAARAGERAGRAEILLAVDTLVRDTGYAVIELQRAAALREVAEDQRTSIAAISRLVRDRYETGGTTQSDALQAQARVEAAEAMMSQIEAEQRRWSGTLAYALGRRDAPAVTADVPDWLATGCARAGQGADPPAVQVAEAELARATADLRRSRAERLPTVGVGADASTDAFSPFGGRAIYGVGLRVTSAVFSGGAVNARVRGAGYALAAAEANVDRARNDAAQRLAEARGQVPSLERLLATLDARRGNMRQTGDLYRLQYLQMGTRTLVDLLNAEQEFHQVRFDAANVEHDLRRIQIDCLYQSGRLRDAFGLTGTAVRGVTL
jgi:outer membrane protein, adhesin transport system